MTNQTDLYLLCHHGIKGQKWGVRRTQAQLGYKTGPTTVQKVGLTIRKAGSSSYKIAKKTGSNVVKAAKTKMEQRKTAKERSINAKKPLSQMSDQELRSHIERMKLEQSYQQYLAATGRNKSGIGGAVKDALAKAGKKTLESALEYVMGNTINNVLGAEVVKVGQKKDQGNNKDGKGKDNKGGDKPGNGGSGSGDSGMSGPLDIRGMNKYNAKEVMKQHGKNQKALLKQQGKNDRAMEREKSKTASSASHEQRKTNKTNWKIAKDDKRMKYRHEKRSHNVTPHAKDAINRWLDEV